MPHQVRAVVARAKGEMFAGLDAGEKEALRLARPEECRYLVCGTPKVGAIDDGELDVVLLYPRRFLSWIPLAVRVLAKRRRTDDTVNRMTGRTVNTKNRDSQTHTISLGDIHRVMPSAQVIILTCPLRTRCSWNASEAT